MNKQWLGQHQDLIVKLIQQNKLPHALLVTGVKGSGKKMLANWLVELLHCIYPQQTPEGLTTACGQCKHCQLYQNESYPDSFSLTPDGNHIGVDEIRNINQFLQKTAMLGSYQTVVIEQSEKMTLAAANALLKTLEEPTENTVIILLAQDKESLLPTIVSRCQLIDIRPPVGNALAHQSDEPFVNISHLTELNNEELANQYQQFANCFIDYLNGQSSLEQLLILLNTNDEPLVWLQRVIVDLQRNLQKTEFKAGYLAKILQNKDISLEQDSLWAIYQAILNCAQQVKSLTQVNSQMAVEKLLVEIGMITNVREH